MIKKIINKGIILIIVVVIIPLLLMIFFSIHQIIHDIMNTMHISFLYYSFFNTILLKLLLFLLYHQLVLQFMNVVIDIIPLIIPSTIIWIYFIIKLFYIHRFLLIDLHLFLLIVLFVYMI